MDIHPLHVIKILGTLIIILIPVLRVYYRTTGGPKLKEGVDSKVKAVYEQRLRSITSVRSIVMSIILAVLVVSTDFIHHRSGDNGSLLMPAIAVLVLLFIFIFVRSLYKNLKQWPSQRNS